MARLAMQMRKCSRCGHDNVPRAIFCYQCGRNLDDPPIVRGLHGTGKLVEDALRFIKERGHTLEPGMVERLKEARAKSRAMVRSDISSGYDAPITVHVRIWKPCHLATYNG